MLKLLSKISIFLVLLFGFLTGCANEPNVVPTRVEGAQWDFDHQLQYRQKRLNNNKYYLEVIPNSKVNFERLSAFLFRRGYLICQSYGYKLELIRGVENFDYHRASPNLILPNLTARLECPKKQ